MEYSLAYRIINGTPPPGVEPTVIEEGEATARLTPEKLILSPGLGQVLELTYREITSLDYGDYRIKLTLSGNDVLELSHLGYHYEDFLDKLISLRNEMLVQDFLAHEKMRKADVEGEYRFFDHEGTLLHEGSCRARLYETSLVVFPVNRDLLRITYSELASITGEGYSLVLETEHGEKLVLSQMGREREPFVHALSAAINELDSRAHQWLQEMSPSPARPLAMRQAARLLREGRAASRRELEAVSPLIWAGLEEKIAGLPLKEEYTYLKSIARPEHICIGLKRGLMGSLSGDYIWFLIPIYGAPGKPGNAVAMEAYAAGSGRATYFFRLVSRREYPGLSGEELDSRVESLLKSINRCMLAINFRREPIYLPEEKLHEPRYNKYLHALALLPSLRELRRLFIGRVIHSSFEQWQKDVQDLLQFNMTAGDDETRWTRHETYEEVEEGFAPAQTGGDEEGQAED